MEAIIAAIVLGLGAAALIFFFSMLGGTILYFVWPTAMNAFPRLVGEGWVDPNLSWWSCVCLAWVFGILIRASQTNNK